MYDTSHPEVCSCTLLLMRQGAFSCDIIDKDGNVVFKPASTHARTHNARMHTLSLDWASHFCRECTPLSGHQSWLTTTGVTRSTPPLVRSTSNPGPRTCPGGGTGSREAGRRTSGRSGPRSAWLLRTTDTPTIQNTRSTKCEPSRNPKCRRNSCFFFPACLWKWSCFLHRLSSSFPGAHVKFLVLCFFAQLRSISIWFHKNCVH